MNRYWRLLQDDGSLNCRDSRCTKNGKEAWNIEYIEAINLLFVQHRLNSNWILVHRWYQTGATLLLPFRLHLISFWSINRSLFQTYYYHRLLHANYANDWKSGVHSKAEGKKKVFEITFQMQCKIKSLVFSCRRTNVEFEFHAQTGWKKNGKSHETVII